VTVPDDAEMGFHTFAGYIQYYIGAGGPYGENIAGDSQVFLPPELEGHVSFSGKGAAPCSTWIEPFVVKGFEPGNLSHVLWIANATTNNTGVFIIPGLTPGMYDVGIKNWTCLSELVTGVTLSAGNTTVVNLGTIRVGDANDDDYITIADRTLLYGGWGTKAGDPGWRPYCDFNNDGYLTVADRTLMYGNWGQKGGLVP